MAVVLAAVVVVVVVVHGSDVCGCEPVCLCEWVVPNLIAPHMTVQ